MLRITGLMTPRRAGAAAASICLLLAAGCTDRYEDSNDRKPGPPAEPLRANAMEGSPSGRGISPGASVQMANDAQPLVTIQDVTRQSNMEGLIGRQVQWRNVPVQAALNNLFLIVGGSGEQGVVVRLKEPIPGLQAGHSVHVSGIIAQLGEDLAHWQLDQEQKQRIAGRPIFVNAFQAERAGAR